MPQKSWSDKRERQYEHIKVSAKESGRSPATARRIAAATVNKTRAKKGETASARSKTAKKRATKTTARKKTAKRSGARKKG